jgi:hypothetical protein
MSSGLRCGFLATAVIVLAVGTLIGAGGASAGPAFSETTPFPYDGVNPCTGEAFSGTGTLHILVSENLSTSGALQYHLDARLDGLQAVTSSGKKYVVQDTFDHEFVFAGAAEDTFDLTAHFVRVGEDGAFVLGDDFYEFLRAHVTANANGIVTAFDVRTNAMPCQ